MEKFKGFLTYKNTNGKTKKTMICGKTDYFITIKTLKKLNFKIINFEIGV